MYGKMPCKVIAKQYSTGMACAQTSDVLDCGQFLSIFNAILGCRKSPFIQVPNAFSL